MFDLLPGWHWIVFLAVGVAAAVADVWRGGITRRERTPMVFIHPSEPDDSVTAPIICVLTDTAKGTR